jgi:peptidoglycan hydrolase-like protein with peptidoglycan-binding domain
MKALQNPITANERSFRVNLLQVSLQALGFPVDAAEVNSHTAGDNTINQVRAFQQQANIPIDNSVVADDN